MTEEKLVLKLVKALEDMGFTTEREVPFWLYRLDVVAQRAADELYAVEAKIRNWQRAIEQAKVYQLCVPHVVIAMPEETARRPDSDQLSNLGIGLWAVGNGIEELVPARQSPVYRVTFARLMGLGSTCP